MTSGEAGKLEAHSRFYAKNAAFSFQTAAGTVESGGIKEKEDGFDDLSDPSVVEGEAMLKAYVELDLPEMFFDISEAVGGKVEVLPLYSRGVMIVVHGVLKKLEDEPAEVGTVKRKKKKSKKVVDNEGCEVHRRFNQRFLLLPEKIGNLTAFFIVQDHIEIGRRVIVPKEEESEDEASLDVESEELATGDAPVQKKEAPSQKVTEAKQPTEKPSGSASVAISETTKVEGQQRQDVSSSIDRKDAVPSLPQKSKPSKPLSYASAVSSPKNVTVVPVPTEPVKKPQPTGPAPVKASKPAAAPASQESSTQVLEHSLCAKRVPVEATEGDIRRVFEVHGKVKSVEFLRDSRLVFVEFENKEPVKKLLEVDVKDRNVKMKLSSVKDKEFVLELWKKGSREGGFRPSRGRFRGGMRGGFRGGLKGKGALGTN